MAFHSVFDNIDFPAYEYREFPKWVTPDGAKPVLVHDDAEEATAMAGSAVVRESDERARLIKVADTTGVTIDKRWALPRMAKAIEAAGFDPDLDPDA